MNVKTSAVIAGVGLLATACNMTGNHVRAAGVSTESYYQQAVAFAKCMRSHGDPSFPDPGPGGAFPNNNGSLDKTSAAFKTASAACKKLEPGAPPVAQFKAGYERDRKYAACMRAHGMPKFPDPVLEKDGEGFYGDINPNSSQFKAADQACKSLHPGPGNP